MNTNTLPVAKFRAGQISSAVWKNEQSINSKSVTIYKASVQRRYRDKDGNWQSSGFFSRNEIPLAVFCLERALEAIIDIQNKASENNSNGTEEIVID